MKITRTQLRNLIKEEMNRLNERNPDGLAHYEKSSDGYFLAPVAEGAWTLTPNAGSPGIIENYTLTLASDDGIATVHLSHEQLADGNITIDMSDIFSFIEQLRLGNQFQD